MSRKLPPGHGWAYLGVILGLIASVAGNVANTVLAVSDVDLKLRIPFAVAWPVFVYIGIEVLTRVEWHRNWRHWIARLMLMGPMTLVAAFMSYLHLNHLMILSGEPGLAQAIGPLAIDGTLFGCTVALLVTRAGGRDVERKSLAERVAGLRETVAAVADAATGKTPEVQPASVDEPTESVQPDPIDDELQKIIDEVKPRSPSARSYTPRGSWDIRKAVELIADEDLSDQAIADLVGTGVKGIQRARRGYRHLRANPTTGIPAEWKVPAAVVDVIREMVRR
jgi:hypothetical protein